MSAPLCRQVKSWLIASFLVIMGSVYYAPLSAQDCASCCGDARTMTSYYKGGTGGGSSSGWEPCWMLCARRHWEARTCVANQIGCRFPAANRPRVSLRRRRRRIRWADKGSPAQASWHNRYDAF